MKEQKLIFTVLFIFSVIIGLFLGLRYGVPFPAEFPNANAIPVKQAAVRSPVKVPIAIYHSVRPYIKGESAEQDRYDITPELLAKHIKYIKDNGYTAISFDALADYFDEGKPLPVKPIILSFDDSWRNQYLYAFPLLTKEKITATFFVFTNSLNHGNHLSWDEVRDMKKAGMEIGSHTKFHPYLDNIASPTILAAEVSGSKTILEESIGTPITAFAYPFGEHGTTTVAEVKRAGYRIARAIRGGNIQSADDRYALRGFIVSDDFKEFVRIIKNEK
ncbi:MAG: polysaccharide deacetylase family protein [Candidatus Paceibacterota bacterium]|nr:polysaccharide deacetylase family protein [Candidatus Paceibacterota bacterium]